MQLTFLHRYSGAAFVLLRVFAGLLFACHGVQKVFGVLGGNQAQEPLMWLAGIIELVAGLAIAVGLLVQPFALLAAAEMLVAYFYAHFSFPDGIWPIQNRGELALLYFFIFLYIATRGPGKAGWKG